MNRTTLWALLVSVLLVVAPARAEEPEAPAPSGFQAAIAGIDGVFARWFVGPMASVMFFDLVFWDDTLPPEQVVGSTLDGQRYMGHGPEGYEKRQVFEIDDPELVFDAPTELTIGKLKASVRTAQQVRADGTAIAVLLASVPSQPVDVAALGLEPDPEGAPVVSRDLAPFPIRVDVAEGRTVEASVQLDGRQVPLQPGLIVRTPDGQLAGIEAVRGDRAVVALARKATVDPAPVPNPSGVTIPAVVAWLVFGAVFFTLRMQFVNVRMFAHALVVTSGRYDDPNDPGEISHFQALSSALSATVGLGNIAGVAIAVSAGGPGAIFWMIVAGVLGMSSKFTECTLGQMYRIRRPDGSMSGGPMHYLGAGLEQLGLGPLGRVLAVIFAVMCVGGSLGGGNMFQANQSNAAVLHVLQDWGVVGPESAGAVSIAYGLVLAFVVGLVIIGGIQRIGMAAGLIVPLMCGIYVLAGLFILVVNAAQVPAAFLSIVQQAFTPEAGLGGMIGVLIQGFRRAAFSNEAGVGSASIAHSAATTQFPVREGIVALLEPFIDTVVVCTMTGLVVVVTGAYQADVGDGVVMTQVAFAQSISWFPVILSAAVILFAFSTMISWSYYGERCTVWLLGDNAKLPYRVLFLLCVFLGANFNLGSVLDFSDLMILGMAFPNILGAILLSGKVKAALDDYVARLRKGEFDAAGGH